MPKKLPSLIIPALLAICTSVQLVGSPVVTLVSGNGLITSTSGLGTQANPMIVNVVVNASSVLEFSFTPAPSTPTPLIAGGTGDPYVTTGRFLFNFTNNTGQTAVGAYLQLGLPNGFPSPQADAYQFVPGSGSSPSFPVVVATTITSDTLTFSGGSVAPAAAFVTDFKNSMNDPTKADLRMRANLILANQQAIPEPTTIAMFGLGVVAIGISQFKRRNKSKK